MTKSAKPESEVETEVVIDDRITVVLDLPPAAGGAIQHAGVTYLSRTPYRVSPGTAADLREIENRCKAHEASLHESENKNRRAMRAFA